MVIGFKGGGAVVFRNYSLSDFNGTLIEHEIVNQYISGGTSSTVTVDDSQFTQYSGATYYQGGKINVTADLSKFSVVNQTPEIATIGSDGTISRVAPGVACVYLSGLVTVALKMDLTDKTEVSTLPGTDFTPVTGSLAAHCANEVDSRITGAMTMEANGNVFTEQDHAGQVYVRNSSLWCADVDLTCVSPWNSNLSNKKAGTLLTPRHVLGAAHYSYPVGTVVRFVAGDNTVHDRTVLSVAHHPDYAPYYPDLTIYTLDSDLPAAITPCQLMPADWNNYLVRNFDNRPPGVGFDQEEKALIMDFFGGGGFMNPLDSDRLIFHEAKISGDSGNPAFLIVGGELVLVTVWTYGGAGSGTPVSLFISDLNTMIATADTAAGVSTGYTVTVADFSAYPDYS